MTNKEIELLLIDLCGRLHTFLYVNIKGNIQVLNSWADDDGNFFNFLEDGPDGNYGEGFTLNDVKPYLRPLSSMTEEEIMEFTKLFDKWHDEELFDYIEEGAEFSIWKHKGISPVVFDWLNAHHFDYRGLIEKGLALEAPENMYKVK